jgi:aminobenzoyl-glutamate transport protein
MGRFLRTIERGGNALPHPATLFLIFAVLVVLFSEVAVRMGVSAVHPKTKAELVPVSLMTVAGMGRILTNTVTNFTGFAPLGTVLVALLGIGIAESSGLIGSMMRLLVLSAPKFLLTFVVVLAGVLSNVASEIGYVLLVPLAALIFQAAGRHPIVGLAASFAGVSGGYSANLLIGTIDPLLSGITQEAARLVEPTIEIDPTCNYYFMVASTFLIAGLGVFVTERFVAPRFGAWSGGTSSDAQQAIQGLSAAEKKGLWAATGVLALLIAVALAGLVPADGFLRSPEGDLFKGPFMKGVVTVIFVSGALCGLAYGVAARTIRSDGDAMNGMAKAMETLGSYLVLVFFAAQFVAYFDWTNLGLIFAVKGAETLQSSGIQGVPVLIAFIFLTAVVNLFMGSASAKWALMAPVFVPMLMLNGIAPDITQCAYRVGDSCTNIISPMMSYFALIIAFFQRYDPKAGIGTLVATMLPYTIVFILAWSVFFAVWVQFGWPLGPG